MKIILHGGYAGFWENAGSDIPLFQKLVNSANQADKEIMISFLSQDHISEYPFIDEMLQSFDKIDSSVKINISDRANFRDMLNKNKVLFLQGGDTIAHVDFLSQFSREDITEGKSLVGGSSSGATNICNHGFTSSGNKFVKGKGILDLAIIPHANAWEIKKHVLEMQKITSAPVLLLNENEILEFELTK